jgi:hypothetical protein
MVLQQMQDQGVWLTEILDEFTLHEDPAECFSWKLLRGGLRIHELGAVHLRSLIVKTLMFYRLMRQLAPKSTSSMTQFLGATRTLFRRVDTDHETLDVSTRMKPQLSFVLKPGANGG